MRRRRSGWSTCFRPAPRAKSSSSTGSRSSPSTTASSHRPSFGAWTLYGLGSEAEDLPGFVVLTSAKGTSGGASNYGSGFLPTSYGGIPLRSSGDPVLYLSNPRGVDRETQRASLDTLGRLNEMAVSRVGDPETASRIQA